jgi:oxygen-dependent protoporphyrinogen oxidase
LRYWDTLLLESDHRVGGRIRSARRGQYWLNGRGHVFAGPGTSTDALLNEVGTAAVAVPGSLKGPVDERQFIRSAGSRAIPSGFPCHWPLGRLC